MPEKVQGIVLDSFKFKESSLVCKIYTKQHGLLSIMVHGVRSKKAKVSMAYLQPLSHLDFLLYYKETGGILRASEFSLLQNPTGVSLSISKCAIALFVSEIVLRTFRERETEEKLYVLLEYITFIVGNQETGLQDLHLYFLFHYSKILGFSLKSFRNFVEEDLHREPYPLQLDVLIHSSEENYHPMGFSREERVKLLKWILRYYMEHMGTFPVKSIDILEDLLSTKHGV